MRTPSAPGRTSARPRALLLLLAALLAAAAPAALAAEARPAAIAVAMDDNYPPFSFRDGDGRSQGILIDQWRLFEARTGIPVTIQAMDWGKALARMRAGECQVIDTIFRTEERARWLDFTPPYVRLEVPIFFDREIAGITDAASLRGFPVAVKAGDAAIDLLKAKGVDNLIPFDSYEAIVLAAKERRVNVFVVDRPPAIHFLAKHGILERFKASAPLDTGEFHRAVRRGDAGTLALVQEGFARIAPQELEAIERRWYGSETYDRRSLRTAAIVVGALVVALAILFVWNRALRHTVDRRTAELRRSLAELQEKTAFIHTLINTVPDLIWLKDAEGTYLACNRTFERCFAADGRPVVGRTDHQLVEREKAEFFRQHDRRALEAGHPIGIEEEVVFADDGRHALLETIKTPMRTADGALIGVLGIGRDITARKRAEEELRRSQALLRGVIESADDCIFVKDEAGRCILHNAALATFFQRLLGPGYPAEGILGRRDRDYLPAAVAERIAADDAEIIRSGRPRTIEEGFPLGGQVHTFLTRKIPFPLPTGTGILGVARDITDLKRTEHSLRESEARFRAMFNAAQDGILIAEASSRRLRYANPAICRLLGYREEELLALRVDDLHAAQELPRALESFARLTRGESSQAAEVPMRGKDGAVRHCDITAQTVEIEGAACLMGMFRDVTVQRQVAERLRQAEKMQAIGQLAAGVAHDFNNMLAGILGAAELVERRLPGDSPLRRPLDIIAQSAVRAGDLTAKLLAFARRTRPGAAPVDLHQVLRDAVALLQSSVDRRIAIVTDLGAAQAWSSGDAAQLQGALLNLGVNAAQAMPAGGTLTFSTRTVEAPAAAGLGPGPHLAIDVRDTGCGIPAEHLPRIFEPFFTTKAPGQGTGLGLAVVFGTVQQHHGAIEVESTVGAGTCIRVLLPLRDPGQAAAPAPAAPAAERGGGGCRILVADDEAVVRETMVAALEGLGHRVLAAEDGRRALELVAADPAAFDLAILDQIMPEMNGRDCFTALRRVAPGLRVILASGYIRDEDLAQMRAEGLDGHLHKPFRLAELAQEVGRVLGGAGRGA